MSPPTAGGVAGRGLPTTVVPSTLVNVGFRFAGLASVIGVGGCRRQSLKSKPSTYRAAGKTTTSPFRTTTPS